MQRVHGSESVYSHFTFDRLQLLHGLVLFSLETCRCSLFECFSAGSA